MGFGIFPGGRAGQNGILCYFPKKPKVKTYPNLQVVDHFLALTKKRKERKIKAHLSSVPVVNYP